VCAFLDQRVAPLEARLRLEHTDRLLWDDAGSPAALEHAERAWRIAQAAGVEQGRARSLLAQAYLIAPDTSACLRHARAARRLSCAEGDARSELWSAEVAAMALMNERAYARARRFLDWIERRAEVLGLRVDQLRAQALSLYIELQDGRPSWELVARARELLADPVRIAFVDDSLLPAAAAALAELGDVDGGRVLLEGALAAPRSSARESVLCAALVDVLWLAGRPRQALISTEAVAPGSAIDDWLTAAAAWASADLGRVPEREPTGPYIVIPGAAETRRALRALVAGNERAELLFVEAAESSREWRFERRCLWGAAEAARRAGARARARRRLLALEEELEAAGMGPLLDRVRRSLRLAGVRRPLGSPRGLITSRERQVLALVAEGLTSEEIARRLAISRRTVESHVASARRKLDSTTRGQAAALVAGSVE
jgi:DNA-binding CsgD family transcriptional regulator